MVSWRHTATIVGVFGYVFMITTVVCQPRQRTRSFQFPSLTEILRQSSQLENAARQMDPISNRNLPTPPVPRFGQSGSSGELLGAANIPGGPASNGERLGAANIPGGSASNGERLGAANIPGGSASSGELLGVANIPGMRDQTQPEQFIPRTSGIPNWNDIPSGPGTIPSQSWNDIQRVPGTIPSQSWNDIQSGPGTIPSQSWNDIQSGPGRTTSGQDIFNGGNVHRDANVQPRGRQAGVDLTIDNRVPPNLGMAGPEERQLFDPLAPTGGLPMAVDSLVDVPLTGRGTGSLAFPPSMPREQIHEQTHIDLPGEHGNALDIPVVHMSNDPPPPGTLGNIGSDLRTDTRGQFRPGASNTGGHSITDQGRHIPHQRDQGRHMPPEIGHGREPSPPSMDIHIDRPGQHGNNMGEESLHLPPGMKISDLNREQLVQLGILPPGAPNVIRSGGSSSRIGSTRPVPSPQSGHGGSVPSNRNTGGRVEISPPSASIHPATGVAHGGDHTGLSRPHNIPPSPTNAHQVPRGSSSAPIDHTGVVGRHDMPQIASSSPHQLPRGSAGTIVDHTGGLGQHGVPQSTIGTHLQTPSGSGNIILDHTGLFGHHGLPQSPTGLAQPLPAGSGSTTVDHTGLLGHHGLPQSLTGLAQPLPAGSGSTTVDHAGLLGHQVIGHGSSAPQASTALHPALTSGGIILNNISDLQALQRNPAILQSILGHHPTGTSAGGGVSGLLGSVLTSASTASQPRPSSSPRFTSVSIPIPSSSSTWNSRSQPIALSSPSFSSISIPSSSSSWGSRPRRGHGFASILAPNYPLERAFRTLFL